MAQDLRLDKLHHWLQHTQAWTDYTLETASADASFRRYFRVYYQNKRFIIMDAPPDKEDIRPFIDVTQRLLAAHVHAPQIYAKSLEEGFLLLEDLGSTPYLSELNAHTADRLYGDAINDLVKMQQADRSGLPRYNRQRLQDEMQLMPDWFLGTHLKFDLSTAQQQLIQETMEAILAVVLEQPNVFVHRDYHSRNLMRLDTPDNPGVIDYQDAVYGAATYDLVSLLRDCYIVWPQSQVRKWALQYRDHAVAAGILEAIDDAQFLRWFDFMGLQRHIKVLGIFARLWHRDGKSGYLNDLPLTLSYTLHVGRQYPETQALMALFDELDIPKTIGTVDIPA